MNPGDRIFPCMDARPELRRNACIDWVARKVTRTSPWGKRLRVYYRLANGTEVWTASWVKCPTVNHFKKLPPLIVSPHDFGKLVFGS